ncbi:tRNA pseudouridine(55) synthase TruB [Candidatus Peregrinibacteria bacterium]|nr:tRNA pseudouridine(55) synthase TruB [Candidatus Peregrinibacteria bacterium]
MNGFLLIDKDKGMTSFDVVREVRRIAGEKKVGHAGTLDPLATGLLLVAVGEGTKLLEFFIGSDKEYEVSAVFGFVSDTYDAEGKIEKVNADAVFEKNDLEDAIKKYFIGEFYQMPPKFSALKIKGRRAYESARKGEKVELKARKVKLEIFDIIDFKWPKVSFRIKCGSGTYVRSLVHDLGQRLNCGAYVENLRRIKVGNFSVADTVKLKNLDKKIDQYLISLEEAAKNFVVWKLNNEEFYGLSNGNILKNKKIEQEDFVMAFYKGKLVGVLENSDSGVKYRKMIRR